MNLTDHLKNVHIITVFLSLQFIHKKTWVVYIFPHAYRCSVLWRTIYFFPDWPIVYLYEWGKCTFRLSYCNIETEQVDEPLDTNEKVPCVYCVWSSLANLCLSSIVNFVGLYQIFGKQLFFCVLRVLLYYDG